VTKQEILRQAEKVIGEGPYTDTWESLSGYTPPRWYQDAKFGIFIHWGVYSVPAFGSEWYPRNMYKKGTPEFEHHLAVYGGHKQFGYKDFIPLFKGEKFDPRQWARLFREAGARYIMPVAEHHDGFQMYASDLSRWNAAVMGPKRDVLGELKTCAEEEGLVFCVSNHRAEHCWFFNRGREFDSDINDPVNEEFYSKQQDGGEEVSHDVYSVPPNPGHCEDWLARACELVDKYRPGIVWFDWWIHNTGWKPWLKKFAAYYYNRAAQWGAEVAINYKYNAFVYGSAVLDIERGQLAEISPRFWQTDTAVAKNSWGYTENNEFKKPEDLVCDLVDIVSKNGALLLNVGPRADGTITEEDRERLLAIGRWLTKNGEGIYGSTYWRRSGEGPTRVNEGAFTDTDRSPFTSRDFRFTVKRDILYAFVMKFPPDGSIRIPSLGRWSGKTGNGDFDILSVRLLGYDNPLRFSRDQEALFVQVEGRIDTGYPVGLAIQLN
jgi:alpha-L-fucosidase